jgi:hypothetical protein
MTPYRFDAAERSNGAWLFTCDGHSADGERKLAGVLVESDYPDGPIEAGRPGRVDWTYPSLHEFAAGEVRPREAEQTPERLHPTLRAAVVALGALRALRKAQVALGALALCAALYGPVPGGI